MKPIIIINTFKNVFFDPDKKPIVICDIDYTFLRPIASYREIFEGIKTEFYHPIEVNKMIIDKLQNSIINGDIKQTDEEGFSLMLQKINQLGGKLLFLTSRSQFSHAKTLNDLRKAGISNPQLCEIHYTANEITKGEYIKKYNLLKGYDHHTFIDDLPQFLESALRLYPDMNCYLFRCYE